MSQSPKSAPLAPVSIAVLATVTGYTRRQLTRLVKSGVIKAAAPRRYALARAVPALLAYVANGREDSETLADAKLRLTNAQHRQIELSIAERERKLIPLEAVQSLFDASMVIIGSQLDGIGGRLAGTLASESNPAVVRAVLFDECRRIRRAAAENLGALSAGAEGLADVDAPADENGG